jgi:hypothetical protein
MTIVPMRRFTLAFTLFTVAIFALPPVLAKTVNVFVAIPICVGGAVAWHVGIWVAVNRYGSRAY